MQNVSLASTASTTTTTMTTATATTTITNETTSSSAISVAPTCLFGQYNFDNNSNGNSNSSPSSCRPIRSQRTPMREITTLDDPSELDDFMQQGEEACIQDMKQFITQFSLRQTTVAMMTGRIFNNNFYMIQIFEEPG